MRSWLLAGILAILAAGCSREARPVDARGRQILRLGYMPNLTHAPALLGIGTGFFEERLGPGVAIDAKAFNAGPSVIEAVFAGDLDVAYVGPNPAINGFVRSRGTALRIVAGSTSGGAALVVQPDIRDAAMLDGRRLAVPSIANTQDVSLRTWLRKNGLSAKDEGGTVEVLPIASADTLTLFRRGELAGAWVPEPTVSRLVLEAGGVVLVDERSQWPSGNYPTTEVIASAVALRERPELVRAFVAAHEAAVQRLVQEPGPSRRAVESYLSERMHLKLPPEVRERAFEQLGFGVDPLAAELEVLAERARNLGYLPSSPGIEGILDLRFLGGAD
ncbi:MAG TPA: ABC transporter substrate-binding protein [Vulgatibacter sp.]